MRASSRDDLKPSPTEAPLAEELPEVTSPESVAKTVQINAYERSPEARARCIEIHGTACVVCGLGFGKMYGSVAQGFIHVHHLVPISEIGSTYEVDPRGDLRPVCPNCHAVIHLGGECRSIEEVKGLLS